MGIFSKVMVLAAIVTLSVAGSGVAEESAKVSMPNPHSDKGDCATCHVAPAEKLRSWFTLSSTKRQLVADPTTLCQKCHGVSFGHGVGKKPDMNRADLPLDDQGNITCALTCHNMHISGVSDQKQLHYHLRLPNDDLCNSCHNK